jgi:hypothetical protein
MRTAYQSDLSDAEWALIEPHLPAPRAPRRPRLHPLREILDAVFYVVRGGCTWRLLPHVFPTQGRPSTITSVSGASTALGSGCGRQPRPFYPSFQSSDLSVEEQAFLKA